MSTHEAAERILRWADASPFSAADAMLVAAAATCATDFPLPSEPGYALVAAAARERSWEELEALALAIPAWRRETAVGAAESLLARRDPQHAWQFIVAALGAATAHASPLCGLVIAARLAPASASALFAEKLANNETFARQWRADQAGRERMDALSDASPFKARLLPPAECASLLIGTAQANGEHGIALALEVLALHPPQAVQAALDLFAFVIARAGLGARIVTLADEAVYLAEEVGWTRAAAIAGIVTGADLATRISDLAPRLGDELEPADELDAVLDLTVAALAGGLVGHPMPGLDPAAEVLQTATCVLFDAGFVPDEETIVAAESWPAPAASGPPLATDVLRLAAVRPWQPVPGTLADILGLRGFD